jgi:MFS family permease
MTAADAPDLSYSSASGRWVLAASVLGSGIAALDATVVTIALPTIGRDFRTGVAALQWVMNGYTLSLAAFLLIGGSLGDRFGRRKVAILPALAGITGPAYLHPDALAAGFRTAVLISGALCAAGGLLAAVTITNPARGYRDAALLEQCLPCGLDAPPLTTTGQAAGIG